jgi:hypothetical protein
MGYGRLEMGTYTGPLILYCTSTPVLIPLLYRRVTRDSTVPVKYPRYGSLIQNVIWPLWYNVFRAKTIDYVYAELYTFILKSVTKRTTQFEFPHTPCFS